MRGPVQLVLQLLHHNVLNLGHLLAQLHELGRAVGAGQRHRRDVLVALAQLVVDALVVLRHFLQDFLAEAVGLAEQVEDEVVAVQLVHAELDNLQEENDIFLSLQ